MNHQKEASEMQRMSLWLAGRGSSPSLSSTSGSSDLRRRRRGRTSDPPAASRTPCTDHDANRLTAGHTPMPTADPASCAPPPPLPSPPRPARESVSPQQHKIHREPDLPLLGRKTPTTAPPPSIFHLGSSPERDEVDQPVLGSSTSLEKPGISPYAKKDPNTTPRARGTTPTMNRRTRPPSPAPLRPAKPPEKERSDAEGSRETLTERGRRENEEGKVRASFRGEDKRFYVRFVRVC